MLHCIKNLYMGLKSEINDQCNLIFIKIYICVFMSTPTIIKSELFYFIISSTLLL